MKTKERDSYLSSFLTVTLGTMSVHAHTAAVNAHPVIRLQVFFEVTAVLPKPFKVIYMC